MPCQTNNKRSATMPFFDVHTHLHDERIIADIPGILARAEAADVHYMASCATMEDNFQITADLAAQYGPVLPCFGVHPWFLNTLSSCWEQVLGEHLTAHPSGVGETGLDFMTKTMDRELQIRAFSGHLALANDLMRPITIHIRKAWDRLLRILKQHGPLKVPGLIHSYSGSADLVPVLEKYNLFISFSGSVTRPNAKKTIKALAAVPLHRLLFETDTPDIFPTLTEGDSTGKTQLNEPGHVPAIAGIAAERRGIPFEKLARHAYENACVVFDGLLPARQ